MTDDAVPADLARDEYVLTGGWTHRYLSTACLHGEHLYCQAPAVMGEPGVRDARRKIPAQCKFCDARCVCPCHTKGDTDPPTPPVTVG